MNASPINKIPILTYHSIDESGSVISTKSDIFRKQIKFLSEAGYKTISLETLGKHLRGQIDLPPKTIVLTFDDGFQNFYTTAFPILSEYNFTATVFLITDYCGTFNDWSGNLPGLERSNLMNWDEIRELSNAGIEFGAHSLSHADLTRISTKAACHEIIGSKTAVEERLGKVVTAFAYPYGSYNTTIKRITQEYFTIACTTNLGKVEANDDMYALKRLDTYYLSNERIFRQVLSENFDWYISFRQTMREVKAACYSK